jgi:DNA polymerase II small subunit
LIERLVDYLGEHGCLAEPEALAYLARKQDPERHLKALLAHGHEFPLFLTLSALQGLETPSAPSVPLGMDSQVEAVLKEAFPAMGAIGAGAFAKATHVHGRPLAADHAAKVELIKDSGASIATEGKLNDFVRYFNDRFETLGQLLRRRREVANAVPIKHAHAHGKEVQLIGFVQATKTSPNGHVFIDLEDDTGTATILVHLNTPHLVGEASTLMPDEVIGVVASAGKDGDLLIAKEIVRPDIPMARPRAETDNPLCAAFLSDIHVGSNTFLPKHFERMVAWFQGRGGSRRERALAGRVKYLVLAGDIVDGVGIYPGQEQALNVPDVTAQYAELSRLLEALPDHVHVVVQPGNHDAVRPTEPQPPFNKEIQGLFGHLETTFVSNPSSFRLDGRNVLSYHGFSMIDFATRVPGLRMDQPMPIMQRMLRGRHLAPTYGGATPLSPEQHDYLVVDQVPDIFVTGHVHVNGLEQYRGVTMVNAGTWQEQTDYQKTHNLVPTPARMPVVELGSLNGTLVDFSAA